jgi:hypothetical protein
MAQALARPRRLGPTLARRGPPDPGKLLDTHEIHLYAFVAESRPLEFERAAPSTQHASGRDDPVTRRRWILTLAEDCPDRARRARCAGERRHVTVGGNATGRNAPDGRKNPCSKAVMRVRVTRGGHSATAYSRTARW